MIGKYELKQLLEKYGVNADIVIDNNENVLTYGEYLDIDKTLDYLINELKVNKKSIEKCPSILFYNTGVIKENYNFLSDKLPFNLIENCLHILSTEPSQLKEMYKYIVDNYGKKLLLTKTSILSIPVDRIISIEKLNIPLKNKSDNLSIAFGINSLEEIQEILNSKEYKEHPELFTSTVLAGTKLSKIKEILNSREYKDHPEMFTSQVLARATLEEIQEILNSREYRDHPEMFTSQVLAFSTLEEIQEILNSREYKEHPEMFTSEVLARATLEEIQEILNSKEYKEHPKMFTSEVLARATLEEIQEILNSKEYKEHPELFTSTVLANATLEDIKKLLRLTYWQDERYNKLLSPTIVAKSRQMITKLPKLIKLAEYYKIDRFINTCYLIKSPSQNYALICYLKETGIGLVIDEKLHPIFSYQPGLIKKEV